MEKKDVTKTELKKASKELNEQLGLEPPILLGLKVAALEKKVVEAAALIDPEEDEFSDGVWDILEALECATRPGSEDDDETGGVLDEGPTVVEGEDADALVDEALDEGPTVVEGEDADALVDEALDDTLVEDFKGAKKLAELKTLAEEWECFADLDLDKYKGLSGPRELRADMLGCLPDDVREQVEPKAAEKPVKGEKTEPVKEKKAKGPGVIATIAKAIEDAGENGVSKDEILEKLVATFPERDAGAMKKTINVQVPTRISKEKFKVGSENGRYFKE
jgi:hypothetical protein